MGRKAKPRDPIEHLSTVTRVMRHIEIDEEMHVGRRKAIVEKLGEVAKLLQAEIAKRQ